MTSPSPSPSVVAPGSFHIGTGGLGVSAGNVVHSLLHSVTSVPGALLAHDWWLLLVLLPVVVVVVITKMGFR